MKNEVCIFKIWFKPEHFYRNCTYLKIDQDQDTKMQFVNVSILFGQIFFSSWLAAKMFFRSFLKLTESAIYNTLATTFLTCEIFKNTIQNKSLSKSLIEWTDTEFLV